MTAPAARHVPRQQNRPIPYAITPAGLAALATDPAHDLRHEPRTGLHPCDGRGCNCRFPGPKRGTT